MFSNLIILWEFFLSESGCISASGFFSKTLHYLFMLFIHSAFLLCFFLFSYLAPKLFCFLGIRALICLCFLHRLGRIFFRCSGRSCFFNENFRLTSSSCQFSQTRLTKAKACTLVSLHVPEVEISEIVFKMHCRLWKVGCSTKLSFEAEFESRVLFFSLLDWLSKESILYSYPSDKGICCVLVRERL